MRPGRAVVVILAAPLASPEIALRHEIDLADAWLPESLHPYHRELGGSGAAGVQTRLRGCAAALQSTRRAIRRLVDEARSHGFRIHRANLVADELVDPARVRGAHPRAHAQEDRLYREAVEAALAACGVRVATIPERDVRTRAAARLGRTPRELDAALRAFSHVVGTPWRGPEKNASLAAWLALATR